MEYVLDGPLQHGLTLLKSTLLNFHKTGSKSIKQEQMAKILLPHHTWTHPPFTTACHHCCPACPFLWWAYSEINCWVIKAPWGAERKQTTWCWKETSQKTKVPLQFRDLLRIWISSTHNCDGVSWVSASGKGAHDSAETGEGGRENVLEPHKSTLERSQHGCPLFLLSSVLSFWWAHSEHPDLQVVGTEGKQHTLPPPVPDSLSTLLR